MSYYDRRFHLTCKRCGKTFIARSTKKNYCNECSLELEEIAKYTCSLCGKFVKNLTRDQNGRGYECGCHEKWNRQHWAKYNGSEKARETNRRTMLAYIHSEEGKKHIQEHNQSLHGPGKCVRCGKHSETRFAGLCNDCRQSDIDKMLGEGACTSCGKVVKYRNVSGYCPECLGKRLKEIIRLNVMPGTCSVCGQWNEERDQNGRGKQCGCSQKAFLAIANMPHKYHGMDLKEFYSKALHAITYEDIDATISLDQYDSMNALRHVTGVWARWTDAKNGNVCLDVCKSVDIGGEMLSSLRSFQSLRDDPEQCLDVGWKRKYSKQLKDCGDGNIVFKLVALCSSQKEALMVEMQYAYDHQARYWSPEPGQRIMED